MSPQDRAVIRLDIEVNTDEERAALEQALLRARASELTEVRRRDVRLTAGYGDATTRDSMAGEGATARRRHEMLDRMLAALEEATSRATDR
jgi:hypothetical protein